MSDDKDVDILPAQYRSMIFQFIHRQLGYQDPGDAEKLTEDTFECYAQAIPLSVNEDRFTTLLNIAKRLVDEFNQCAPVAAKLLEKYSYDKEVSDMIQTIGESKVNARQWFDIKSMIYSKTARDRLSPRCLEIFFLRKIEGCSYSEIAEKLNISQADIEMEFIRARRIVSETFKPCKAGTGKRKNGFTKRLAKILSMIKPG